MTVDLNGPNYAATASPIYRAVWEWAMPLELFAPASGGRESPEADATMRASLDVLRARREAGTLCDADGRLAADLLQGDLAQAGYWGLLIPQPHGGSGATLSRYAKFLTRVAAIDGSVANLLSVHSCLGPGGVVRNFGSDEQKQRWLPLLARGEQLGVFALTEPQAGSDLTAIAARAELAGDAYRVTGEKVFITNLAPGRVAALVCRLEGRPAVLIAQLPDAETDAVRFIDYGIHAARRSGNRGMRLRDFAVPRRDLIVPSRGDGLTIAYHGLNQGRMSVCAVAAGTLRRLLASLLPWVRSRRTYGEAIGSRELVQRRIGRLASLIMGCDALAAWCATLLDRGYRGELECMVAKIFAGEALKEAAIEIGLRTFGGRTFLHGNPIGDSLHDLLAPCIYEGENELLSLGLLHSLAKPQPSAELNAEPPSGEAKRSDAWSELIEQAARGLRQTGARLKSAAEQGDRRWLAEQCEVLALSRSVQQWTTVVCLSQHARTLHDAVSQAACLGLAESLLLEASGLAREPGSASAQVELGKRIVEGGWAELEGVVVDALPGPIS